MAKENKWDDNEKKQEKSDERAELMEMYEKIIDEKDGNIGKIGYEINFNKYFYEYRFNTSYKNKLYYTIKKTNCSGKIVIYIYNNTDQFLVHN